MADESTTPDLVERTRRVAEAIARGIDAAMSAFAPDTVVEMPELGTYMGREAYRGFVEDWLGASKAGIPVENSLAKIWALRECKLTRMDMYSDVGEALQALGLDR